MERLFQPIKFEMLTQRRKRTHVNSNSFWILIRFRPILISFLKISDFFMVRNTSLHSWNSIKDLVWPFSFSPNTSPIQFIIMFLYFCADWQKKLISLNRLWVVVNLMASRSIVSFCQKRILSNTLLIHSCSVWDWIWVLTIQKKNKYIN